MKLNTQSRYGARAMLALALKGNAEPLSAKEIAEDQDIPIKYLESLLAKLRKVGLINSVRGAGGGYLLAKPPTTITLREIYEVFEGREAFVPCTDEPYVCERSQTCPTQEVWASMFARCMAVLESWTVEDLARQAREKQRSESNMYYI